MSMAGTLIVKLSRINWTWKCGILNKLSNIKLMSLLLILPVYNLLPVSYNSSFKNKMKTDTGKYVSLKTVKVNILSLRRPFKNVVSAVFNSLPFNSTKGVQRCTRLKIWTGKCLFRRFFLMPDNTFITPSLNHLVCLQSALTKTRLFYSGTTSLNNKPTRPPPPHGAYKIF